MKWYTEQVEFSSDRIKLYGVILIPEGDGTFPGVVMCHGMASDHRAMTPSAQRLVRRGVAVLAFDFRGHGKSGGVLNAGLSKDVVAAMQCLRRHHRIDPKRTAIVGHSMGAMAAMHAATALGNLRASVFISSPGDMDGALTQMWAPVYVKAQETGDLTVEFPKAGPLPQGGFFTRTSFRLWMWIRGYRMRIKLEKTMESWSKLNTAKSIEKLGNYPKLFVQCKGDRWIPYESALCVYDKAGHPKKLILSDSGSHTTPLFPGKLRRKWISWLVSELNT